MPMARLGSSAPKTMDIRLRAPVQTAWRATAEARARAWRSPLRTLRPSTPIQTGLLTRRTPTFRRQSSLTRAAPTLRATRLTRPSGARKCLRMTFEALLRPLARCLCTLLLPLATPSLKKTLKTSAHRRHLSRVSNPARYTTYSAAKWSAEQASSLARRSTDTPRTIWGPFRSLMIQMVIKDMSA